ncbi:VQ motif-containing protein [Euphorbia peplus]|nr:VQ motif-containing protein [Euphorbia peplus]
MESANSTSPLNSPHTNNNNGVQIQTPISRSDHNNNNPYPTTFVQADTSTFKQVVQMLTGSSTSDSPPKQSSQDPPRNFSIPPIKNSPKRQQQQQQNSFKLYERRNSNLKNSLIINTLLPNFGNNNSPRHKSELLLSPSMLDFPNLTLSPVTPLNEDTFNNSSPSLGSSSEEERAIAEKGFYLHPSPISTPRDSEPQLLSLFPLTSPKLSGS